jgi:Ca-activated chloride channel family protein
VVFVIDISGSMLQKSGTVTRLAEAQRGLMQAVAGLRPEQRFNILFFADRVDAFMPAPAPALPETKLRAFAYIDSGVDCGGSTNLQDALRIAMAMAPDTLLLLSDGEANTEDDAILAEARHLRRRYCPGLQLHAIGFYLEAGGRAERFLKRLSQENQGSYALWRPRAEEVRPGS